MVEAITDVGILAPPWPGAFEGDVIHHQQGGRRVEDPVAREPDDRVWLDRRGGQGLDVRGSRI
jgi:hypothetical protein